MATKRCLRAELQPNWLDLPNEIIELMMTKLPSVDVIRFKGVCLSWYAATNSYISTHWSSNNSDNQSPWLMLPTGQNDSYTYLFNFAEQKHYKVKNVFQRLGDHYHKPRCVGSSFGWLIIFDENCNACLLNPFSGAQIELPSTEDLGGSEYVPVTKAILLSDPSSSCTKSFTIIIIYCDGILAFYSHIGDHDNDNKNNNINNTWTDFCNDPRLYCDMIYHDSMLYALEHYERGHGCVEVWDLHRDFPKKITRIIHPTKLPEFARLYLAESLGDILYVLRITTNHDDDNHPDYKDEYFIYKLNYCARRWEKVKSLKGQTLFLGGNKLLSLCARDFPEWEQNSLYITYRFPFDLFADGDQYFRDVGKVGVYNFDKKSLRPDIKFNIDHLTDERCFTPFWIVLSDGEKRTRYDRGEDLEDMGMGDGDGGAFNPLTVHAYI
ncbi:putative F-box protein At4g17565 [Ziziphus jujuba]|uniref:F-box protein At4g17565 n=1 Tax=Ziziphus jujuba TaxID=326968 RepID=A0ABM3ZUD1_ZIZJJ|nr:putative F-box protein At4g17565 [Ziziphus jujuba]